MASPSEVACVRLVVQHEPGHGVLGQFSEKWSVCAQINSQLCSGGVLPGPPSL